MFGGDGRNLKILKNGKEIEKNKWKIEKREQRKKRETREEREDWEQKEMR